MLYCHHIKFKVITTSHIIMLKQSFSKLPRNKRIVALAVLLCVIVAIAVAAVILLRKPSATVVSPVVTVAPARIDDVEILSLIHI